MERLVRVDMTGGEVSESGPGPYEKFGGRSLTSMAVAKEVPPACHPLGPSARLVISPGLLSGSTSANSGRLSIGAKSPLTGGIKESNVGGTAAYKLARLGVRGIVIQGMAVGLQYLLINKDGVTLHPADEYKGMGNYECAEKLREKHGGKPAVLSIGPAGEMKLSASSIAVTDTKGRPSRHAGRGGLGAVMASRGLKAIVVDDRGAAGVTYADKDAFKAAATAFRDALHAHPVTKPGGGLGRFGTNSLVSLINASGAFPTRNFTAGQFEGAAKISGEALFKTLTERGGEVTHSACTTCIIGCSNVFVDKDKNYVTSGLEYETVWANGANCGIDDLDAIARIDRMCDDFGMDTMETGGAIAIAMAAGLFEFGDVEAALDLVEQVGKGTPMGRIIGSGAAMTAQVLGVTDAPVVKRQSMSAYDPRAIKGIGVTYATSPMGADHTAGYTIASNMMGIGGKVDPLKPDGQVELSRRQQILAAILDSAGLCSFVSFAIADNKDGLEAVPAMLNARHGWSMAVDDLNKFGRDLVAAEIAFNRAAGLAQNEDDLPEFFRQKKLAPHGAVFDVPEAELKSIFD